MSDAERLLLHVAATAIVFWAMPYLLMAMANAAGLPSYSAGGRPAIEPSNDAAFREMYERRWVRRAFVGGGVTVAAGLPFALMALSWR